jgi:type II secretory pathway pseudopilin PulG
MNKYNHGVTIVEILLSVLIIGLVIIILFNMLVSVRNEDQDNQIQSQYVLNQSTYVEAIQEDIINYGVSSVSACDLYQVDMDSYNINNEYRQNFKCIRFNYSADYLVDNIGYLMIYNYNFRYDINKKNLVGKESSWMIRYIRGHYDAQGKWSTLNSLMNEIPDEAILDDKPVVKFNRTNTASYLGGVSITIPIQNKDAEHYDIALSFLINPNYPFVCYSGANSSAAYAKLDCECQGVCDNAILPSMYNPEVALRG